jgi:hypothetical protein
MAEITRLTPLQLSSFIRPLIQAGRLPRMITRIVRDLGFSNPVRQIQQVIKTLTAQERLRGALSGLNPSRVIPPNLFTPSLLKLSQPFGYVIQVEFINPLTGQREFQHVTVLSSRRLTPKTALERATEMFTVSFPAKRTPTVAEENVLSLELISAEERQ